MRRRDALELLRLAEAAGPAMRASEECDSTLIVDWPMSEPEAALYEFCTPERMVALAKLILSTEAGAGTPDAVPTVALGTDGGEDPKGETRTG